MQFIRNQNYLKLTKFHFTKKVRPSSYLMCLARRKEIEFQNNFLLKSLVDVESELKKVRE